MKATRLGVYMIGSVLIYITAALLQVFWIKNGVFEIVISVCWLAALAGPVYIRPFGRWLGFTDAKNKERL